ncbi:hypothetical protein [Neisseria meningitidis]|uniref:hypothetical protein n=1 Tax=Neisseria meningitidis TaxID=487 RepID=UPI00215DB341|nr:hypothetical protein [Neisseria meningitidis]
MNARQDVEIAQISIRAFRRARLWQGWKITAIARHLGIKPPPSIRGSSGELGRRLADAARRRVRRGAAYPTGQPAAKSDGVYKEMRQLSALIAATDKMPSEAARAPKPDNRLQARTSRRLTACRR